VHGSDQLDELVDVLGRDARHRLVEQDHIRLAGEEHRELELPFVAVGEQTGRPKHPRVQANALQCPLGTLERLADRCGPSPDPKRATELGLRGETRVLPHREEWEDARHLEGATQAGPGAPIRRRACDVTAV
jgi:hypothetical protein